MGDFRGFIITKLTKAQRSFLAVHEVPLARVFDATGKSKDEYREIMSKLELWVAYGVVPCRALGHSLRVRSGHCVQCKPANLSYLRRHDEAGEVYVAHSRSGGLVKVGTSQNALERLAHLNSYEYGGRKDWVHCFSVQSERAGKVESRVHTVLAKHAAAGVYLKNGSYIECRELFSCAPALAVSTIKMELAKIA